MKSNADLESPTVAELSDGLVAISIENSECDSQQQPHTMTADDDDGDEAMKDEEPLLPNKMGYEWKEITQEFFEAVKELQLGELVHHQKLFGLFEAMSAIEMMDPKMDAGMCCNKNPGGPLTFETAIEMNKMKLASFEPSELIGIMDGIYACLVSWLDGHSLAQTMFTCLYLHQPHNIEDKTLRAFCCAMHKLTQIIRKFVLHAKVFEEEDFDPRDYGYVLTPDVVNTKACFMLKEAEEELTKQLKANPDGSEGTQAIIGRLKFLRLFLQALTALAPSKSVSPNEQEMNEIVRLLSSAADLIPLMKRTICLGTQPDPNDDAPNPMGFSPTVNQRILPPTFPRYTKIKARDVSISFFEELVHRTKQACKIIHCVNYHSALNFFIEFSKKSGPCLLSRSILQCLYFPQPNLVFGTTPVTDMLRDSVKIFCAPTVLVLRNNFTASAPVKFCLETFFKYCMNMYSFVMFIQICGYNRARQRDKLARLLDDFANLQDEAERVDTYLFELNPDETDRRPYFSTWVLYHCLRAMAMYLLSGLELELYSVHEYMYIYWYLSDFLYNWIITTLTRAECLADQLQKPTTKSKKPKAKKKSMKLYCREVMFSQALKNMFSGYYNALAGFTKDNRIPQPLSIFDNERVRFDHRFAPFYGLTTPPPVSYNQFKEHRSYQLNRSSMNLYLDASNYFHRARTILESIPNADAEIVDIIKIAKINYVVMNLLATGHKKESTNPPQFDFSIHKYFPTIKQN